jgi:DNA-binding response OmpR family regulator
MPSLGRVLVVDDDDDVRDFVSMALLEEGYEVQGAPNGAAALELAGCFRPRVILLDMKMPVLDGWKFAAAYRERDAPRAAIICMTAAGDAAERCAEIQADAYLSKPFDLEELFEAVARYMP